MLCLAMLTASSGRTLADCETARSAYDDAIKRTHDTVRSYLQCLAASAGSDDCANEFRQLAMSQDDIEEAVAAIEDECN
jgi:hypothetical protein